MKSTAQRRSQSGQRAGSSPPDLVILASRYITAFARSTTLETVSHRPFRREMENAYRREPGKLERA